jgi:hypothetical protein
VRTIIIAAFMNNDMQEGLPSEQGMLAVGTKIFSFEGFSKTIIGLKERRADLAAQLGA